MSCSSIAYKWGLPGRYWGGVCGLLLKHLETLLSLETLHFSLAVRAAWLVSAGRVCPHAAITLAALWPEPPILLFLGGGFHWSVLRMGIEVKVCSVQLPLGFSKAAVLYHIQGWWCIPLFQESPSLNYENQSLKYSIFHLCPFSDLILWWRATVGLLNCFFPEESSQMGQKPLALPPPVLHLRLY